MPSLTRWKLPKSRSGRRPISVSTLLKREAEGLLFKKHGASVTHGTGRVVTEEMVGRLLKHASDEPELLAESGHEDLPAGAPGRLDANHDPALRPEKTVLAGVSRFGRLVGRTIELDGELSTKVGQVDVVAPDGVVQDELDSQSSKPLMKEAFEPAHGLDSLPGLGDVSVPSISPLGVGPHGVALTPEPLFDGGRAATKLGSDFSSAEPSLVELNHPSGGYLQPPHVSSVSPSYGYIKTADEDFKLQGSLKFQGLDVAVENKPGSVRKGTNADGSAWKTVFKSPYGYIRGTKGADDEEVDCYVGPDKDATTAYVVHQRKDDGSYDEDTIMLGYGSKSEAKTDILRHYSDPKYVGSVHAVSMEKLHEMLSSGKKLTKISHIISNNVPEFDADDDAERATGIPAHLRKRPGEVPSKDEVDLLPTPKTEARNESRGVTYTGGFPSPGGDGDDFGKFGRALDALGDISRSWEVPTSDDLGNAPADPGLSRRTARETDDRTHFVTLSEIGDASVDSRAQEAGDLKVAAAFIDELQKVASENGHNPWVGDLADFRAYVEQAIAKLAGEVTRDDAHAALERLRMLENAKPTQGQLLRGAAIGALTGPLASNVNRIISKGELHTPREIAGQVAGGLIMGTAVPLVRQKIESTAERRTLKDYINAGHGGRLATQIQGTLGTT